MKGFKSNKNSHTSNSQMGMGDNYGTGIKNKVGKMRDSSMGYNVLSPKKLGTPPKKVA